jgi:hypothetical protein
MLVVGDLDHLLIADNEALERLIEQSIADQC